MMRAYAINPKTLTVNAYATTKQANEAHAEDEDFGVYATEQGLIDDKSITMTDFVALYNGFTDKPRKGFDNRAKAVEALFAAFLSLELAAEPQPVAMPTPKPEGAKKGRPSPYAGKRIFPTKASMEENPRREGSVGYQLMELCRQRPGITYEEYAQLGGASNHVKWDVDHGFAILK